MASIKEVLRAIPSKWAWNTMRVEGAALMLCAGIAAWREVQENIGITEQMISLRSGLIDGFNVRPTEGMETTSDLTQQITLDQLRRRYWLDILSEQSQRGGANTMLLTIVAFLGAPFTFNPRGVCGGINSTR